MKIDILKHTILNTVKSVSFGMKKPDRKFLKTILENMLEYKTTVLSRMGDTNIMDAKYWLKYYSNNLGKECWNNLGEKVEKVMKKFIGKLDSENCICFDSVDTNKNSAKKMEGLKIVRDGSKGTFGNGYVWHGVSIKSIPLFFYRERVKKDDKDIGIRFEIFEKQVRKILSMFGSGYWILADRLYDDFKKFKLLINLGFKFSIRLKTTRNLQIINGKNKGQTLGVNELEEGNYTVKITGIEQELYVFVKTLKGQTNSIKIISNINDEKALNKYLERWEIERIFKVGKQEFDFEKIGTKQIQKTENLVYLVQLCLGISGYIYNKLNLKYEFGVKKNETILFKRFYKKLKLFLKKKSLDFNRNSITIFIAYYMNFIRKAKNFFKKRTLKPPFNRQLSLKF